MARFVRVEKDLLQVVLHEQKVDEEALRRRFRVALDAGLTPDISAVMRRALKHLETQLQKAFDAHKADEELLKRALKTVTDAGLTPALSRVVQKVQAHLMKVAPRNCATRVPEFPRAHTLTKTSTFTETTCLLGFRRGCRGRS